MKLQLKGSLQRYDCEAVLLNEWERMWQKLGVEYWQALFDSCGNTHPCRSLYGQQLTLAKRQTMCTDLLYSQLSLK